MAEQRKPNEGSQQGSGSSSGRTQQNQSGTSRQQTNTGGSGGGTGGSGGSTGNRDTLRRPQQEPSRGSESGGTGQGRDNMKK